MAKFGQLLVAFHDRTSYRGEFRAFYGNACSSGSGNIDDNLGLGFMANRGESVTKGAAGHCNWQMVGSAGKRSTWVENSRPNLGLIGDGWNNRAVSVRLT